jgi:hypothetical protein
MNLGGFHHDFMGSELRPVFGNVNSHSQSSSSRIVLPIQTPITKNTPEDKTIRTAYNNEPPPKYEDVESSPEITTLFLLKPYQKLRSINNTIAVETRNRIMRTFSRDSREQTYQDIKRILETAKTSEERFKITTGINVLTSTTYKNDKKWVQKVLDLINLNSSK